MKKINFNYHNSLLQIMSNFVFRVELIFIKQKEYFIKILNDFIYYSFQFMICLDYFI